MPSFAVCQPLTNDKQVRIATLGRKRESNDELMNLTFPPPPPPPLPQTSQASSALTALSSSSAGMDVDEQEEKDDVVVKQEPVKRVGGLCCRDEGRLSSKERARADRSVVALSLSPLSPTLSQDLKVERNYQHQHILLPSRLVSSFFCVLGALGGRRRTLTQTGTFPSLLAPQLNNLSASPSSQRSLSQHGSEAGRGGSQRSDSVAASSLGEVERVELDL